MRHAFAAEEVGNTLRIFLPSRFEYTHASNVGLHEHFAPSGARQERA